MAGYNTAAGLSQEGCIDQDDGFQGEKSEEEVVFERLGEGRTTTNTKPQTAGKSEMLTKHFYSRSSSEVKEEGGGVEIEAKGQS